MKLLEVRDSDVDGKILEDCCGCLTVQTLVRWFSKFFLALGRAAVNISCATHAYTKRRFLHKNLGVCGRTGCHAILGCLRIQKPKLTPSVSCQCLSSLSTLSPISLSTLNFCFLRLVCFADSILF